MIAALACSATAARSQAVAAESPRVEGVTASGPEVVPIVSDRDLRMLPPARAKDATVARPYRPLLAPPPTTGKTIPSPGPDSNSNPVSASQAPMPAPAQNFAGMSFNDACTGGRCGGSFRAAQRGNYPFGTQTIAIVVDDTTVGLFTPPDSTYAAYSTPTLDIASSGTHTMEFVGVGSGTDFTAFVDDVHIAAP